MEAGVDGRKIAPVSALQPVLAPLWVRLLIVGAILGPVLVVLVPDEAVRSFAAILGADESLFERLARVVQAMGVAGLVAVAAWSMGRQQGRAFGIALVKSVLFAVLVGVPFTVGMIALCLLLIPTAPIWVHVFLSTVPVIVLVVGMSMWFSRNVKNAAAKPVVPPE